MCFFLPPSISKKKSHHPKKIRFFETRLKRDVAFRCVSDMGKFEQWWDDSLPNKFPTQLGELMCKSQNPPDWTTDPILRNPVEWISKVRYYGHFWRQVKLEVNENSWVFFWRKYKHDSNWLTDGLNMYISIISDWYFCISFEVNRMTMQQSLSIPSCLQQVVWFVRIYPELFFPFSCLFWGDHDQLLATLLLYLEFWSLISQTIQYVPPKNLELS